VQSVREFVAADRPVFLAQWQRIALIPAPEGEEAQRAELIASFARETGAHTEIDRVGNVVAVLDGSGTREVTFLATMDDLASIAEHRRRSDAIAVEGDRLVGPCSQVTASDATGLALLRFARAHRAFRRLTVAFVLGEETGLSGVRELCAARGPQLGWVIDLMGGVGTISWNAIGFDGVIVEFSAPPRHSLYGGVSEVSDAVARFVAALHAEVPPTVAPEPVPGVVPAGPLTIRRVNQLAAGEVFNHSPQTGTVSVDLRSTSPDELRALGVATRETAAAVAAACGVAVTCRDGVQQPAALLPGGESHPLVVAAADALRDVGVEPILRPWSSSNINVAYEHGLEGIVHDDPTRGAGRGTPDEWADVSRVLTGLAADCRLLELISRPAAGCDGVRRAGL
jgi:acetylornithine deacetylase/succinyl-diaminopimelate desuccinylase-like protein